MNLRVYRSLDRPSAFFGIRGRYQSLALFALLADIALSFFFSKLTNGLLGVLAFITLGVVIYLGILFIQPRYSSGKLTRLLGSLRLPGYIKLSPCRIGAMLTDNR